MQFHGLACVNHPVLADSNGDVLDAASWEQRSPGWCRIPHGNLVFRAVEDLELVF